MINIFAHRGLWNDTIEPNSIQAIIGALENDFSIETDIRDFDGTNIGISHDPITINQTNMFYNNLREFDLNTRQNDPRRVWQGGPDWGLREKIWG